MKKLLHLIVGLCLILSFIPANHSAQGQAVIEIETAAQFNNIRSNLAGTYRLAADIDLSAYPNWVPIGGPHPNQFTGQLDGNGKKITGLKITETTGTGQGLFGETGTDASIYDLTVIDAAVTGGDNVGILVGVNGGSILRCGAGGSVSGTNSVGGLAGRNTRTITTSYSTATVTGQASVGGLVGTNSGNITASYAASPVLASVFNNYIQFDGVNDYIRIGNIAAYQTASFTLEAWFQWDPAYLYNGAANNDADVQFIVGKGFEQFEIHTEGGSKERGIRFIPIPRTSITGESSDAYNDVLDVIRPGWFHVASSWDYTTKEVRVYINGVQQNIYHYDPYPTHVNDGPHPEISLKNPDQNPFAANDFDLLIGARSPGTVGGNPSMYFKGKIADVRFWNIVRTDAQIDADKSRQLEGDEPGLMGYWKLNEGAGTEALDSSGNMNKGFLVNGPVWVKENTTGAGGLVGSTSGGTITSSFYDSDVSEMTDTGKGDGKTTAEMQSQSTFAGWDFTDTWQMTEGATYPDFIRYQLTYAAGSNGSLSGSASQTVSNGGSGTAVLAVPATGYYFTGWNDGSTANPRTDVDVTGDLNVTANFAINQYTLTYAAGANGSLTGSTSQIVNHNSSGTAVTAVPDAGYSFVKWSDESTANPRTDLNVTGNINVTAAFALNQYSLTYTAGDNGSISGSASQTVAHGGNGSPVSAVAADGYSFVKWSDESTENPRTDLNVTANLSVTASFAINQYTLDYAAGSGGSLTGSTHQTVSHGADGSPVEAVAADHYYFVDWSDGSTANPRTDSGVTENLSVTANFAIDQHTLSYSAGSGGTLTGVTSQTVDYGGSGTAVTADPAEHYHFVRWSDNSTANPRTDLNVTTNITVSAVFAIDQYTLDYAAGAHGSISGSAHQVVDHGSSGSAVTATADYNYRFVDWSDGSTVNPRTDLDVTGSLSVTANFALIDSLEPDTLSLSRATVSTVQTEVGVFNVLNGELPITYSLQSSGDVCTGENGADNAAFAVSGDVLEKLPAATAGSYSICAQAEDAYGRTAQAAFTILVTPPPSDLALSSQAVTTSQELVGTLSSTGGLAPFTYNLATNGDVCSDSHAVENDLFRVKGNALKRLADTPAGTYLLCLQTVDANGAWHQEEFEVTVSEAAPPPAEWTVVLTADQLIENDPVGTVAGTLVSNRSGTTYSLVDEAAFPFAEYFSINAGGELVLSQALPAGGPTSLPIRVRAATPAGDVKYVDSLIWIMKNGSSAGASAEDDTGTVNEGGSIAKDVLSNDQMSPDANEWVSVQIVRYPQNGSAQISNPAGAPSYRLAPRPPLGILYTPNPGFSGTDSVTYRACDNLSYCVMGSVEYTVNKVWYYTYYPFISVK